ncbi:MAG: Response regulator protein VraR, partial [Dehalococcoidia bacterium]|nr:Response regulator protein VraR [Dehalococcoidia bacterium]
AKGYRNNTIGEVLCVEPKTVERHINSIFGKLSNCPESKHTRVHAITLYLRATGQLPAQDFEEE